MNSFKLMLRFTGILAALAIAATPLTASAQTPPSQTQTPQNQQNRPPRIVLSQEQEDQFKRIEAEAIADINTVLSQEQKNQFAASRQNGRGFLAGLGGVQNLSDSQITRIQKVVDDFFAQFENILTREQKEQIERFQQSQQNQRTPR